MEMFERLDAIPWAGRARSELRASGETVRRRDDAARLTPQELQVAQLVATGASTKMVAAQLYLSPRTVDAHLRQIFTKLGISSRAALRDVAPLRVSDEQGQRLPG
jgi:DNA-binding NarL/FixJ family response regulator